MNINNTILIKIMNLENAKNSIERIKIKKIQEICSFKTGNPIIVDIMIAILMLFDIYDFSWERIKDFLLQPNLIDNFLEFDETRVTPLMKSQILAHINNNPYSFNATEIGNVEMTMVPFVNWIIAIISNV